MITTGFNGTSVYEEITFPMFVNIAKSGFIILDAIMYYYFVFVWVSGIEIFASFQSKADNDDFLLII